MNGATLAAPIAHPRWRARMVLALLLAGFALLTARAVYLQGWHNEFLQQKGGVDMIVDRRELRDRIASSLAMLQRLPADAVA